MLVMGFVPHGLCAAELGACFAQPECGATWLSECLAKGPGLGPEGIRDCDKAYFAAVQNDPNLSDVLSPLYACMCQMPQEGKTQVTYGYGSGECSDVCAGALAPAEAVGADGMTKICN